MTFINSTNAFPPFLTGTTLETVSGHVAILTPTLFLLTLYLSIVIPHIAADLGIRTATWGKQGQIDPFQEVYTVGLHLFYCQVLLTC